MHFDPTMDFSDLWERDVIAHFQRPTPRICDFLWSSFNLFRFVHGRDAFGHITCPIRRYLRLMSFRDPINVPGRIGNAQSRPLLSALMSANPVTSADIRLSPEEIEWEPNSSEFPCFVDFDEVGKIVQQTVSIDELLNFEVRKIADPRVRFIHKLFHSSTFGQNVSGRAQLRGAVCGTRPFARMMEKARRRHFKEYPKRRANDGIYLDEMDKHSLY
jgi:hypothetical protein